jgi:hypothetical protein
MVEMSVMREGEYVHGDVKQDEVYDSNVRKEGSYLDDIR